MNVRISESTLRFRLSNDDLTSLATQTVIQQVIHVGQSTTICFRLESNANAQELMIHHERDRLCAIAPLQKLKTFLASDEIQWSHTFSDFALTLIIEKDLHNSRRQKSVG